MKVSKYVTKIEIDNNKKMLYSTFSRKYFVYNIENEEEINSFLSNINKGEYTKTEIALFNEFFNKKLIVKDECDELRELEYRENEAKYQEQVYKIFLYITNACNFRCSYCVQPHITKKMEIPVKKRVLSLIEKQAEKNRKIEIEWFGGEPLLEYEELCDVLKQANEICRKKNCELLANITTNGYLLTKDKIIRLKNLNVRWMQITLDGEKEAHDRKRMLANGEGTFDVVYENILQVLKEKVNIVLRINIDEKNIEGVFGILDKIPKEYRKQVTINICNIFQNKEKLSAFELLKQAFERGYSYYDRWNRYVGCHACMRNAVIIDTDGALLLCGNVPKDEKRLGYIGDGGNVCIERREDFYRLHTTTARNNLECQGCIELPFCIATCVYAREKKNIKCFGKRNDGLTLKERALLDYYYDLYNLMEERG